ncbi:alpha/beta fold hydrolase [Microvirga sp. 2MCAF35]|uniref:alpha/beta fold hydrolase n=1 Tax=Microvirga sp. 2MCAF35 TaxID=3232987 RepID=UPI003F9848A2
MKDFQSGLFLNKIPYVQSGSGSNPIVVLNGGQAFVRRPIPARALRDARRIARLLPSGRPVYILGYEPSPPADYTVGTIVDDVARILQEIGPATVMGISFGGFVAARLAADRPDLVKELILMVSAHRFSPEGRRSVDRQIACAWAGDFEGFLDEFGLVFRRPWLNWLIRWRFSQERRRLHETMNDPATIVRGLNAVAGEEFGRDPSWLARIAAPALIVGATRDPFFDVAALEETARLIPGAQLRIFRNETHMLPIERARDVAKAIARFLYKDRDVTSRTTS